MAKFGPRKDIALALERKAWLGEGGNLYTLEHRQPLRCYFANLDSMTFLRGQRRRESLQHRRLCGGLRHRKAIRYCF